MKEKNTQIDENIQNYEIDEVECKDEKENETENVKENDEKNGPLQRKMAKFLAKTKKIGQNLNNWKPKYLQNPQNPQILYLKNLRC